MTPLLRPFLPFLAATLPAAAQIVSAPPPPAAVTNCTDVEAGTAKGYACLNQQLGAIARNTPRPSAADAPYSATSPSNVTGQFNEDATRERLGANFGKSGIPQRPVVNDPAPFARPR